MFSQIEKNQKITDKKLNSILKDLYETNFFENKIKYFAGHSLGEYTALNSSNSITFEQGLILLKNRGEAMQSAVPLKGSKAFS